MMAQRIMPRFMTTTNGDASRVRMLQLAVIVVLITIFITVAIHQIWRLRIAAERVAVMQMVGTLRSAISIEVIHRALHGGLGAIAAMDHADPMLYLRQPPANFEALKGPMSPEEMQPYRWYYEPTSGILTYRVCNGDYLKTTLSGPPRIRFQLQVRYTDVNHNHRFDPGIDTLQEVDLVALDRYSWLPAQ